LTLHGDRRHNVGFNQVNSHSDGQHGECLGEPGDADGEERGKERGEQSAEERHERGDPPNVGDHPYCVDAYPGRYCPP